MGIVLKNLNEFQLNFCIQPPKQGASKLMRIISKIEKLGNFQGEIKQRSGDMQKQHKCFALTKGETTHFY